MNLLESLKDNRDAQFLFQTYTQCKSTLGMIFTDPSSSSACSTDPFTFDDVDEVSEWIVCNSSWFLVKGHLKDGRYFLVVVEDETPSGAGHWVPGYHHGTVLVSADPIRHKRHE